MREQNLLFPYEKLNRRRNGTYIINRSVLNFIDGNKRPLDDFAAELSNFLRLDETDYGMLWRSLVYLSRESINSQSSFKFLSQTISNNIELYKLV